MQIVIKPASDTFDSSARPLLAGVVYDVPGDISEDDALICVEQGKAEQLLLPGVPGHV